MANALTLRFGSDVEAAKSGVTSLAASIASNLATVSGAALTTGRSVQTTINGTITAFQNTRTAISLVPPAIIGLVAAFATFKLAESAIGAVKDQMAKLLELADKSRERGVSAEFFQAFTAGAKGAEDRVKALEEALKNAFQATKDVINPNWTVWDQGLTKVTAVEEALRNMRELFNTEQTYTGLDLFRGAENQDQKIQAVLTAMRELNAIGQRTAALDIGEKMFGAEFADKIRRGEESVDRLLDTINNKLASPEILTSETVARAKELDDRLNDAWRTISEKMKPDWDDLGNIALRIKGAWTSIIEAVAKYKAEAATARPFQGANSVSEADARNNPDPNEAAFANPRLLNQGRRRRGQGPDLVAGSSGDESAGLNMERWQSVPAVPEAIPLPQRRPLDAPKPVAPTQEELDAIERFISQMERANDIIKVEIETQGKSNVEREKGIALAKAAAAARVAGRELDPEEKSRVLELAAAHATLADRLKDVQQRQRDAAETARFFGNTASNAFADIVIEARNANEVLDSVVKMLARAALQAAFTGQGPLASFLGFAPAASAGPNAVGGLAGLLTGLFRAGGGDVQAGRAVTVGELGTEIFVPDQDGKIYPIGKRGPGGFEVNIYSSPVFQAGMTPTDMAQIQSMLSVNKEQMKSETIQAVRTGIAADSRYLGQ